jgi:spore coat polysaccharide biosynthesis protein SpsF
MQDMEGGAGREKPRVVAILQARMASTRLPGKVFANIIGQPMIGLIVSRLRPAQLVEEFVIATTRLPEDQQIEDYAKAHGIACLRGSKDDLLDRFFQAATTHHADVVVRLTADNPFVDSEFLDWVISHYLSGRPVYDYVDTVHSKTFPLGMCVEVMGADALGTAWREDKNEAWREHCTPFIYYHPERFRMWHLRSPNDYSYMRWTVDTPEDLAFARLIYEHFGHYGFSWRDVLDVLKAHPEWMEVNRSIAQRTVDARAEVRAIGSTDA